jgi:cellulose synthase (UDP-forming)
MQVLRQENPLFGPRLTLGQRLGFATTLLGWFDSWRTLTFVILPIAVLFTGASPIDAPGYIYAPAFIAAFTSQFIALRLLARGYYPPVLSLVFEMLRLPAVLPATLTALSPDTSRPFKVTPKGRQDSRRNTPIPLVLSLPATGSALALLWFALTLAGLSPVTYDEPPAVIGSAIFAVGNFGLLLTAIRRIRDARFAGERRSSVRFDVQLPGRLNGIDCLIRDVSLTGARVELNPDALRDVQHARLAIHLPNERLSLSAAIVRQPFESLPQLSVRFLPGQRKVIGRLAIGLLNSDVAYAPAEAVVQPAPLRAAA